MSHSAPAPADLGPPPPIPLRRALFSVSDKSGIDEFAGALAAGGVELFASGGTRKHLESLGLPVRDVGEYTGFPEMLDGRVKTLHPKIHGGILSRHDRPEDMSSLARHGIVPFELVVVNLYPFEETIARAVVTDAEAIENIDIGGPSLIRAAAKNHRYVTIATEKEQYSQILKQVQVRGGTTYELRRELATAAFAVTSRYDTAIFRYFERSAAAGGLPGAATGSSSSGTTNFAASIQLHLQLKEPLRYGENPHQRGALYISPTADRSTLVRAKQLHGKELSYNNFLDLDSAWLMATSLCEPAAVVIKHNNPCGGAVHKDLAVAVRLALDGDPTSAFGSVIALNRSLNRSAAEVLAEPDRFVEAIVAPSFEADALEILTTKPKWKANVRLMEVEGSGSAPLRAAAADGTASGVGYADSAHTTVQFRQIVGGFLVQVADIADDPESDWKVVTGAQPTTEQMVELRFGWAMVRHVKSNAITLSKDRSLVGVGAGQMSRVDSVEIAIRKAGDRARGSVLASDAFFPFGDSIELAAKAGVVAIIQPGGSKRDDEVIAACDLYRLPMIFTGRRHFKH
jgi:phosphoribosylaminoimidazolecarboxamide formyltransferase / IMP cyclohydrolase